MTRHLPLVSRCILLLLAAHACGLASNSDQATKAPAAKDAPSAGTAAHQPDGINGDWEVAWQGRLGTEQCMLHLQKEGAKLTGTFQDFRGVFPLAGTVDDQHIFFEVKFPGPRPFTIRFTGTAGSGKIDGTSQAVGVGDGGAYLGHGGEIVQPEHPWNAKRAANRPAQTGEAGSSNSAARN